jgi:cytochrome c peroxidase
MLGRFARLLLAGTAILAADWTVAAAPNQAATKAQYARPKHIDFPATNPYSPAKAELGKILFFDPRLSQKSALACVSCHNPSFGWEDGRARGIGHDMQLLGRSTPTVQNVAWGAEFFWDGRAPTLEEQSVGPIQNAKEMAMDLTTLSGKLKQIPGYRARFDEVFPGKGITPETIGMAIATFQRTVVSGPAPFDRWIEGQETAISEDAKRGFALFNGKGNCAACHSTWRFTDDGYHDIGLPSTDIGRAAIVPGIDALKHAFKTPGLRNTVRRHPYMHDGSIATLDAVVRHYNDGFIVRPSLSTEMKRLDLTETEIKDMVAFLETLSSQDPPMATPLLP